MEAAGRRLHRWQRGALTPGELRADEPGPGRPGTVSRAATGPVRLPDVRVTPDSEGSTPAGISTTRSRQARRALSGVPLGVPLGAIAIEAAAVVVAVALAFIALGHFAGTGWADYLLYDGDSLVLPLVERSLQSGGPQDWVFSSQNFLFPEGLLFALSSVFTESPRVAILVNAVVNLVLLYGLYRVIAHLIGGPSRRVLEIALALLGVALYLAYVLLDASAAPNGAGIAPLFMFSTYYYGALVSGLGLICLILWVTRAFSRRAWGPARALVFGVAALVVVGLTSFSDPLFIAQLVAPILVALLVVVFCARLSWAHAAVLATPIVAGVGIGMAVRALFPRLQGAGVASYLAPGQMVDVLRLFETIAADAEGSTRDILRWTLLGFVVLVVLVQFSVLVYAQPRPALAARYGSSEVFLVALAVVSVLSLIIGTVVTGSVTTRYLVPLFVIPQVALIAMGSRVLRRLAGSAPETVNGSLSLASGTQTVLGRLGVAVIALLGLLAVGGGVTRVPVVADLAAGTGYTVPQCLDTFLAGTEKNGVGSFWASRELELYGDHEGVILQANIRLEAYAWMTNMAEFEGRTFSYVVTDPSLGIVPGSLIGLGDPAAVVECGDYTIYDFTGTPGEQLLTEEIASSLVPSRGRAIPE